MKTTFEFISDPGHHPRPARALTHSLLARASWLMHLKWLNWIGTPQSSEFVHTVQSIPSAPGSVKRGSSGVGHDVMIRNHLSEPSFPLHPPPLPARHETWHIPGNTRVSLFPLEETQHKRELPKICRRGNRGPFWCLCRQLSGCVPLHQPGSRACRPHRQGSAGPLARCSGASAHLHRSRAGLLCPPPIRRRLWPLTGLSQTSASSLHLTPGACQRQPQRGRPEANRPAGRPGHDAAHP